MEADLDRSARQLTEKRSGGMHMLLLPDLEREGVAAIEPGGDAVRGPVQESVRQLAGVVGELVRLDGDGEAPRPLEGRPEPGKSVRETPEHPLGPHLAEAPDAKDGAARLDLGLRA